MNIELIYDADCPNVAPTRGNIAAALAAVGSDARWIEWDRGAADSPSYVKCYGSPTVLVEGQDIAGEPTGDESSCCRVYRTSANRFEGAPSVELISAALQHSAAVASNCTASASGWKSSLATLPAVAAALLPAGLCPALWPVYAGLLSALGLGFLLDAAYLFPLTALLLIVATAALAIRAHSRRGYGPCVLGLFASSVTLFGKFVVESNAAMYGGIGLLLMASVWNAWPARQRNTARKTYACM